MKGEILIVKIISTYMKMLFDTEMIFLFIASGLFLLMRDEPLLRSKKLKRESTIAKALGYTYIIGSIILSIVTRFI